MNNYSKLLILSLCSLAFFACGGGGGGSSPSSGGGGGTVVTDSTATLKLSTQGSLPTGTSLSGIGITVSIPPGVTVKTDSSGVPLVSASGVATSGSVIPPVYTPSTSSGSGSLKIVLASLSATGFGTGEFATFQCTVPAGMNVTSSNFPLTDFKPANLLYQPVTGLTATLSVTVQ